MTTRPRTYSSLTSRGFRRTSPPWRLYQKAKKLGAWDPVDIDLSQDAIDWQTFSEQKKDNLRRLIIAFQAGEEAVTLDLLPLIMTIAREGRLEEEMFLTTFLWEEAKHTEFFRRVLEEALQESGDLHPQRPAGNERDLFGEELPRTMNALLADPSPVNQLRASVMYNMIIEGVLAETGYHSFFTALNKNDSMPGLRAGLQLIKRDESRHIAYGVFLISRLVAQDKSLWPIAEEQMNSLFAEVQENQRKNGTSEEYQAFAKQQFQKRFSRIQRARNQTLEQIYRSTDIEESGEIETA